MSNHWRRLARRAGPTWEWASCGPWPSHGTTRSASTVSKIDIARVASSSAATKGTPLWLSAYTPAPPVQLMPGGERPTAMGWLYRRGPSLPRSVLHRLFRERQVRVLAADGVTVTRAKKLGKLSAGELVFVPRAAVEAYSEPLSHRDEGYGVTPDVRVSRGSRDEAPPLSPASRDQSGAKGDEAASFAKTPQQLHAATQSNPPDRLVGFQPKAAVLHADRDVIVVNKPPFLPMRGANGPSVDNTFTASTLGLRGSQSVGAAYAVESRASGVLLLGKGEAAIEEHRAAASKAKTPATTKTQRTRGYVPKEVKVMYWALVNTASVNVENIKRSGSLALPQAGAVRRLPATVNYRIKALSPDNSLMWLELRPSSAAKTQLQELCAKSLGCHVVGDLKQQGQGREAEGMLLSEAGGAENLLYLHARSVVVTYFRTEDEKLSVTAPLPRHMAHLWDRLGWDHAITNFRRRAFVEQPFSK